MGDEIRIATGRLAEALRRGDVAAVGSLYVDDCRLLTPQADIVSGRLQIEAYWRAGLALGLSSVELVPTEIEFGADTAVEIGRYRVSMTDEGGAALTDEGKYVVLHRKQADGTWLRAVDVFNPDERKEGT